MQWDQYPVKCMYTSAHTMGNKQEEMETMA